MRTEGLTIRVIGRDWVNWKIVEHQKTELGHGVMKEGWLEDGLTATAPQTVSVTSGRALGYAQWWFPERSHKIIPASCKPGPALSRRSSEL